MTQDIGRGPLEPLVFGYRTIYKGLTQMIRRARIRFDPAIFTVVDNQTTETTDIGLVGGGGGGGSSPFFLTYASDLITSVTDMFPRYELLDGGAINIDVFESAVGKVFPDTFTILAVTMQAKGPIELTLPTVDLRRDSVDTFLTMNPTTEGPTTAGDLSEVITQGSRFCIIAQNTLSSDGVQNSFQITMKCVMGDAGG